MSEPIHRERPTHQFVPAVRLQQLAARHDVDVFLNLCGCRSLLTLPARQPPARRLEPFVTFPSSAQHDLCLDHTAPPASPGERGSALLAIARDEQGLTFRRYGLAMRSNLACDRFEAPRTAQRAYTGQPWLVLALWAHLASRDGAYLHGALAMIGGRFVALVGPPDVGKTTLARLVAAAGQVRLSDEHVFVRRQPEGLRAYACPWPGVPAKATTLDGPLAAVFCLRQGPAHVATRLSEAAALRRLIPVTWYLNELSETVPLTMAVLAEMVASVPVYDLAFAPDVGVVEEIGRVL